MHILIVVDDATRRLYLRNILTNEGYTVSIVGNSKEGFQKIRIEKIDLIISDLYMSNTNGFEFREAVHDTRGNSGIPFIFISIEDDADENTRIGLLKNCGVVKRGSSAGEIIKQIQKLTSRGSEEKVEVTTMSKSIETIPHEKKNIDNPNILLVDDDDSFRLVVEDMLTEEGFKVSTAADGEIAIDMLRKEHYDLVLLDIFMPIVSGYGVMKFIHENSIAVKVIILTAYRDLKLAVETKSLGASDFIAKPVMRNDLISSIKKVLSE